MGIIFQKRRIAGSVPIDSRPTSGSNNAVSSGGTYIDLQNAITKAETDLASIHATGTTNTTGAAISSGTYFYLNGALVKAKANIASGATFTNGTNYEAVTAGGLNELKAALGSLLKKGAFAVSCAAGQNIFTRSGIVVLSGAIPSVSFNQCVFMIANHGSSQNSPNTVETDGANTIIVNAKSAQTLTISWLNFSNVST